MKASWPQVRLREVLRQIERAEAVDTSRVYRLLGVRWYGQGLFVREERMGADIAANRLYSVRPGDFVYNRLFAWKGSFAVARAESCGAYVSNEFPCFATDTTHLDPNFLLWFFRQGRTWTEVLGNSFDGDTTLLHDASRPQDHAPSIKPGKIAIEESAISAPRGATNTRALPDLPYRVHPVGVDVRRQRGNRAT